MSSQVPVEDPKQNVFILVHNSKIRLRVGKYENRDCSDQADSLCAASISVIIKLYSFIIGGSSNNNNGRQPGGSFGQQTQVRPTARPSFLPQGCRIEYKVVYSVEEREEYENKCETKYR